MSWMNTITRNATRTRPTMVPRLYEMTPSMPDMRPMIGENALRRFWEKSGKNTQDHRLGVVGRAVTDLGFGRRAHADHGAGEFDRHAGERMVGVEHHFARGDVGDGEDQVFIAAARRALETHSGFERLGKAAARLDPEKILVVVAERFFRLQAHFDAVLDPPALERRLGRRKNIAVAAVQILHRLPGALDRIAPDVGQLDLERDDGVFRDAQSARTAPEPGSKLTQRF